jgi:hypothetical protein
MENKRISPGYTLVEAMTVVAGISIVVAFSAPSISRFKSTHEVQSAAHQVSGMLQRVRATAGAQSTPYLVLFQKEDVADGARTAFALIVRDTDHSYSVTAPDEIETFALNDVAPAVRQYGIADLDTIYPDMPPSPLDLSPMFVDVVAAAASSSSTTTTTTTTASPSEPLTAAVSQTGKAKKVKSIKGKGKSGSSGLIGTVVDTVASLLGGGSSGSSGSSGTSGTSGTSSTAPTTTAATDTTATGTASAAADPTETVSEAVTNGATFLVSEGDGVPAIIFDEHGMPVAVGSPQQWGTGAGGVYLTDNWTAVYAAVVSPMGEVSVQRYDAVTSNWVR